MLVDFLELSLNIGQTEFLHRLFDNSGILQAPFHHVIRLILLLCFNVIKDVLKFLKAEISVNNTGTRTVLIADAVHQVLILAPENPDLLLKRFVTFSVIFLLNFVKQLQLALKKFLIFRSADGDHCFSVRGSRDEVITVYRNLFAFSVGDLKLTVRHQRSKGISRRYL